MFLIVLIKLTSDCLRAGLFDTLSSNGPAKLGFDALDMDLVGVKGWGNMTSSVTLRIRPFSVRISCSRLSGIGAASHSKYRIERSNSPDVEN